jgi:hypothetical protein
MFKLHYVHQARIPQQVGVIIQIHHVPHVVQIKYGTEVCAKRVGRVRRHLIILV